MNSFKTAVAILSPVKFISRFNTWRTTLREEQLKKWKGMEGERKDTEAWANECELKAKEQFRLGYWRGAKSNYFDAENAWQVCYNNINKLTPDARQTRNTYANAIFRCRGRRNECEDRLRRQTSGNQQQETGA